MTKVPPKNAQHQPAPPELLVVVTIASFLSMGTDSCKNPDPPGDGFLLITVTTADLAGSEYQDIESLALATSRIDVVHRTACGDAGSERLLRGVGGPGDIAIATGIPNVARAVARLVVPEGCVLQVRFLVTEASLTIQGVPQAIKVPSGANTGVKVVPAEGADPFCIRAGDTTASLKARILATACTSPVMEGRIAGDRIVNADRAARNTPPSTPCPSPLVPP